MLLLCCSYSGLPADPLLPAADPPREPAEGASAEARPKCSHEAQPVPQQEAEAAEEDHHGGS